MGLIGLALAGDVCTGFGETEAPVTIAGEVPDIQASGLAAARGEDGVFYTHDDSGGDARLYVFREDGTYIGSQVVHNATNTDWEDIAPGPCPAAVDADHCLWIADTGDNHDDRDEIGLWVVPESLDATVDAVWCPLAYPEGKRHDAEALAVMPDGTVRIFTKAGTTKVFRVADPDCGEGAVAQTLTEEAEITLDEKVTGAAVDPSGTAIVLRSLDKGWLWTGCTIHWSDTPETIAFGSQPQGEAVTFANDGSLVTTSEPGDSGLQIWRTPCETSEALECPSCGCGSDGAAILAVPALGLALRRRRSRR